MPLVLLGSIVGVKVTKMSLLPTKILCLLLPRKVCLIKRNIKPSIFYLLGVLRGIIKKHNELRESTLNLNDTYAIATSKPLPIGKSILLFEFAYDGRGLIAILLTRVWMSARRENLRLLGTMASQLCRTHKRRRC
jgi:hypothetical protein